MPIGYSGIGPGEWRTVPGNGRRWVPAPRGDSGGGGRGGAGRGGGAGGSVQQTITASKPPELEALLGKYNKYLSGLEGGTGHIQDVTASKLRDVREGGRRALLESNVQSGRTGAGNVAEYDAETARGEQQAISDVALGREGLIGSTILGGTSLASRPTELALQEKGLTLQAQGQQAQIQAAQQQANMQALLSILQAQRSSPLYAGGGNLPGLNF